MQHVGIRSTSLKTYGKALVLAIGIAALTACGKPPEKPPPAPLDVSIVTVEARDVPVAALYVAQTQSSQAVNIQARVSGFLDKRVYTEGSVVKAGQVLFRMDPKPFQVQVDGAAASLQRNQAALQVATANLNRTKPLAATECAVAEGPGRRAGPVRAIGRRRRQAKAQLESAKLDLSYTIITTAGGWRQRAMRRWPMARMSARRTAS